MSVLEALKQKIWLRNFCNNSLCWECTLSCTAVSQLLGTFRHPFSFEFEYI